MLGVFIFLIGLKVLHSGYRRRKSLLFAKHWPTADGLAYFITKGPWEPPASFDTGLTFNVLWDVPGKTGFGPVEYGRRYVDAAKSTEDVVRSWETQLGPFKAFGVANSYFSGGL